MTSCLMRRAASISRILGKRYARHRDHGVYYALPDGSKIGESAFPMLSPNGCGLSPDGQTLYVGGDTEGARLWAFPLRRQGCSGRPPRSTPHSGRVLAGLPGNARFDSLAVLANGNIVVATLTTGSLTEFSPTGEAVRAVEMPDVYPTNICFGGADMRTAHITSWFFADSGRLGRMQWPEPGLKLHFG